MRIHNFTPPQAVKAVYLETLAHEVPEGDRRVCIPTEGMQTRQAFYGEIIK